MTITWRDESTVTLYGVIFAVLFVEALMIYNGASAPLVNLVYAAAIPFFAICFMSYVLTITLLEKELGERVSASQIFLSGFGAVILLMLAHLFGYASILAEHIMFNDAGTQMVLPKLLIGTGFLAGLTASCLATRMERVAENLKAYWLPRGIFFASVAYMPIAMEYFSGKICLYIMVALGLMALRFMLDIKRAHASSMQTEPQS